MPNLEEATRQVSLVGLSRLNPTSSPVAGYSGQQFPLNPNPFLRSPIPPVSATPDDLRQYYAGGQIPQARILSPATIAQESAGSSVNNTTIASNISNSSTTATSKVGTLSSASITTPVLNPNQTYQTVFSTSTTFVPLVVSVTQPARIELYATATAQTIDLSRPSTISPGPATQQGIFLDVTVTASPMTWLVTPTLPCANNDNPQKALSYITVTNLGSASNAITATLQYIIFQV
jgi:hypothetical protein